MKANVFKTTLFLLCSLSFGGLLKAQEVHYELRMEKPQNHYFQVKMEISGVKDREMEVKMPVWAPGSYLVREFAKNVNLVIAKDQDGKELPVRKTNKNTWKITKGSAKRVTVSYEVYAFELSVRTSFLDASHGFVSGTGVFMYLAGATEREGTLTIVPHTSFKKVTTALPLDEGKGAFNYRYRNYDQLVDCPMEIGNQEEFDFEASGVHHHVGIYGPGNYEVDRLKKDMARIVESETAVFGENPNKDYTFIIHNVVNGQGGLEHINSTTLSVNRWTYQGAAYKNFLSLVAHEYFHLWNVKRIRPIELGPFNYDEENYTDLLWVMEGFTSYYDELIPLRAGYYTEGEYLRKLNSTINYVEGSVGTRVQPVAHASFDAWIKAYRPNENSANTTMTYYSRGAMLAALLDAKIIAKTNGEKCLDHFMQKLYKDFYKKLDRGFTVIEFRTALKEFMGENMDQFIEDFVYGTKVPPFEEYFGPIGVDVKYTGKEEASFGARISERSGKAIVNRIRAGSTAEEMGLSVDDEVIGFAGYRVSAKEVEGILKSLNAGDEINLLIARDDILLELKGQMGLYERPSYHFEFKDGEASEKLRAYWLRAQ